NVAYAQLLGRHRDVAVDTILACRHPYRLLRDNNVPDPIEGFVLGMNDRQVGHRLAPGHQVNGGDPGGIAQRGGSEQDHGCWLIMLSPWSRSRRSTTIVTSSVQPPASFAWAMRESTAWTAEGASATFRAMLAASWPSRESSSPSL